MPRRVPAPAAVPAPDFASLVRQHQAMVFSIAWHLLRDRAVAEELAQDVFLSLTSTWPNWNRPSMCCSGCAG